MITENQAQELAQMSVLRKSKITLDKEYVGKLWLIGLNPCWLYRVDMFDGKSKYITCIFKRAPRHVHGLMTKIAFVPHREFYFTFEQLSSLCGAFGHDLKEKPSTMPQDTYTEHVYKRLRTFVGRKLQMVVATLKDMKTDLYGVQKMRPLYYNLDIEDFYWKNQIVSYHLEEEQVEYDFIVLRNIYFSQ